MLQTKTPAICGCLGVQALSSRIPPIRAVTVTGNLYKPHACLPLHDRPNRPTAPAGAEIRLLASLVPPKCANKRDTNARFG
jgi:hypothetical protein